MTYEEYLEKNGEMTYTNRGVSMLPLLKQDRDMFTVRRKGEERCRKYDVILYRRPPRELCAPPRGKSLQRQLCHLGRQLSQQGE